MLSSSVKANGSVNHWFTAQSFLIPSLTNLWNFCTNESIQAKMLISTKTISVKNTKMTYLCTGWCFYPEQPWLTLFFHTCNNREMTLIVCPDMVSGTFRTIVIWLKHKPCFLSSLLFIFSWQFAKWHKCQKPLGREIT